MTTPAQHETRSLAIPSRRPRSGSGERLPAGAFAVAALLAVLLALAFADVLFGGRTLSAAAYVPGVLPSGPVALAGAPRPPRHLLDPEGAAWVDEPSPYLVHRALEAGRLPLWNPREGLGAPLAANPNAAVWSPLALPVNLWPSPLVQDLAWLGRVWLLGLFTALLARELGLDWSAAGASAAALMLSGQTVDWIAHHPLNTDVFVPLALIGALRTLRGRRDGPLILSAAVAAGLLGGKPQSAVVAGLFGAAWLLTAAPRRPRAIATVLAAVALGLALAAVALVPFAETYLGASGLVRAGRSTQGASALPKTGIAGLLGPWAEVWIARVTGSPPQGAWLAPALPHAGLTALFLATVGLWAERRRALAWALALSVALYLARIFSDDSTFLASLPVVRSISFVKYCFPLYLAIALLAGLGVTALRHRWLAVLCLGAELVWLVPRPHPPRVDAFEPAPYVGALERLDALAGSPGHRGDGAGRSGRIAGPFDLLPPLVSNAVGFADLRAIDVLTPGQTWNFVTRLISPSRGLTWILSDLDPLLVATAPAADLADVRWVLSREPLDPARLPDAVHAHLSARRLTRLFDALETYSIDTSWLWAGIDALQGESRFHWTCATPCRLTLDLRSLPHWFATGIATPENAVLQARIGAHAGSGDPIELLHQIPGPSQAWDDLWLASGALAGAEGTITIEVFSDEPATVWIGGLGPSPGAAAEHRAFARELAAREREAARLELRYADETAHIYENVDAFGPAWVAGDLRRVADEESGWDLLATADRPLALATDRDVEGLDWPTSSQGTARLQRSSSSHLEIQVGTAAGGVLVVPSLAEGWTATVDGRDAAVVRVNGALTGIVLPAGARGVELDYQPTSLLVGASITALALLAWLVWVARTPLRGRR